MSQSGRQNELNIESHPVPFVMAFAVEVANRSARNGKTGERVGHIEFP
jgi:hypothetical protein